MKVIRNEHRSASLSWDCKFGDLNFKFWWRSSGSGKDAGRIATFTTISKRLPKAVLTVVMPQILLPKEPCVILLFYLLFKATLVPWATRIIFPQRVYFIVRKRTRDKIFRQRLLILLVFVLFMGVWGQVSLHVGRGSSLWRPVVLSNVSVGKRSVPFLYNICNSSRSFPCWGCLLSIRSKVSENLVSRILMTKA